MIEIAGAVFVIAGFLFLMTLFGLVERSARVFVVSKAATRDLTDSTLDDDAKETAIRAHAKTLGGLFVLLALGGFGAVVAPLGVIALLDAFAIVSFDNVMNALMSWWMIGAAAIVFAAVVARKRRPDGV